MPPPLNTGHDFEKVFFFKMVERSSNFVSGDEMPPKPVGIKLKLSGQVELCFKDKRLSFSILDPLNYGKVYKIATLFTLVERLIKYASGRDVKQKQRQKCIQVFKMAHLQYLRYSKGY